MDTSEKEQIRHIYSEQGKSEKGPFRKEHLNNDKGNTWKHDNSEKEDSGKGHSPVKEQSETGRFPTGRN